MRSRLLALLPWVALGFAALSACGGGTTPVTAASGSSSGSSVSGASTSGASTSGGADSGAGSGVPGSGTATGSGGGGTGAGSGAASGTASGSATGSGSGAASGTASGASSGATSGTPSSGAMSGASSGGASSGTIPVMASPGCGTAWTHATGTWVEAVGTAASALAPTVTIPTPAGGHDTSEQRGYWVLVPKGYDPTKPYPVIYQGAGCGGVIDQSGNQVFPFQNYDKDANGNGLAIQVGLDIGTYSTVPGCFNNRDAKSNDFGFLPWLINKIENDFCVDTNHQYFAGYSSGGWVAQQFNCAFPDKLRGTMAVSGCEPGDPASQPNANDGQPACVKHPSAAMFIKDFNDPANTFQCVLSACTRVLHQNGCPATSTCQELATTHGANAADTVTYTPPASAQVPANTTCVQFSCSPPEYPVVFCTTNLPQSANRHGPQDTFAIPTFWDFISNKTAH